MIAVKEGMKKKGSKDMAMDKKMPMDMGMEDDSYDYKSDLQDISMDLIKAVKDEDPQAVSDLLEEAFDCIGKSKDKE